MADAYLTTSWDDGNQLDLRLAEQLSKYGIPGTFYVPLHNVIPVMTREEIRELSGSFEIGGHTVSHIDMLCVGDESAKKEIVGCKNQIEEIISRDCQSFCFPKGHFRARHLRFVREAGFRVARTVEMMSISEPISYQGLTVLATTIQSHNTARGAIVRNLVKRMALDNALNYARYGRFGWVTAAEALLDRVARCGGVFHLWGHSWEIDRSKQWENLEHVLAMIADRRSEFNFVTNAELAL